MITYDTFHLIHTLKRQGLYITQISEISQLSENTVRKYFAPGKIPGSKALQTAIKIAAIYFCY